MTKRTQQPTEERFEIREHVSGSFIGASGRVRYEVDAGVISRDDIDPEVLAVLLASGLAVKAAKAAESEDSA
jgi:hypothetical protein